MKTESPSAIPCVFVLLAVLGVAAAQEAPPAMMVQVEDKSEPLALSKVNVEVRIFGYLAETKMTMVFFNPHGRVLAGDLYFPLPAGATISGYALDIDGVMVDGVVVEKHLARQIFEAEVRKGVDPGLAEYVKGNCFKTRVFPILPRSSRTVMVKYVAEIIEDGDGAAYQLPLNFRNPVGEFSIRLEVVKAAAEPTIRQGKLDNFQFKKWRDTYVAQTRLSDARLNKPLVIALPEVRKQTVLVEKASDGEHYFVIHDRPTAQEQKSQDKPKKKVTILWDASGSRAGVDHRKELRLLKQYLDALLDRAKAAEAVPSVGIDLVIFRNAAERPRQFDWTVPEARDSTRNEELLEELEKVRYDGGSQAPQSDWGKLQSKEQRKPADVTLLFTDGMFNFGSQAPTGLEPPLYVFSTGPSVNSPLLNRLAAQNGGQHFNLDQADAGEIVRHMAGAALRFVEARDTAKGKAGAVDMYPRTAQPVRGRFTLAGKLKAGEAKVSLSYDQAGKSAPGSAYAVSVEDAVEGDLLRCFWAQKKLEELMIDQESNRREIIALGKDYGLVTPHTSLLVLERLEQYVEHRVRPPETLAKMRQEYEKAIDTIEMQKKQDKDKQVERILELWQARVTWWDKKFQYPKGFKYGTTEPTTEPTTREGPATEPAAPQVIQQMRDMETRLRGAAEALAQARAGLEAARAAFANAASDEARKQARSKLADSLAEFLKAENAHQAAAAQMQALAELRSELVVTLGEVATSRPTDRDGGFFGSVPARGSLLLGGQAEPGKDVAEQAGGAAILLKEWDPNAPYLKDLKPAEADERFSVYMKHRKTYGNSPAFFLDCADFFYDNKQPALGLQVLSNIAEMELENPQLLRVLAHRLAQLGEMDLAIQVFEEVLKLRPEEPQSYRDLALVLAKRARDRDWTGKSRDMTREQARAFNAPILKDCTRALGLLNDVVMRKWDRFDEIELIALIEANAMLPLAKAAGLADDDIPLDKRLIKLLDCDIRIVLTWDADMTDMDLHVVEPSGERVYYEHNGSAIGGLVSKDFTDGYGPEEYLVHKAMNGMYKIEVNYYGSSAPRLLGAVTVQVEIITNFGRADEKRRSVTRRLTEKKQIIEVGQIEF